MPSHRSIRTAACAVAASLALGGPALAASGPDTTIAVSPRIVVSAPATSPVDFPGVSKVRAGRPLPRGWVAISRDVRITRGAEAAYGALRMTCPGAKTWRSGASSGAVGATILDRNARAGKHSVLVMATFSTTQVAIGQVAAGTIYALCR
ncbi:MAG TPA: hypothetical protein VHZ31_00655 [Solirubrobacteraceae bacterium]|jgi:hypothetical protein|nr:hypothetical protein [Solirubrobacteraceae bacterium]